MKTRDLVVRNADVATAVDRFDADIGIAGGRIVALAQDLPAARMSGLFSRMGTIAIGSDADLVIWDRTRAVDDQPRAGSHPARRRLGAARRMPWST